MMTLRVACRVARSQDLSSSIFALETKGKGNEELPSAQIRYISSMRDGGRDEGWVASVASATVSVLYLLLVWCYLGEMFEKLFISFDIDNNFTLHL